LFDVSFLMTGLFDRKNRYRLFREKILPALYEAREPLCALYCEDNGRPAIEPVVAAGVTLLQFMEKIPDRQAVEMLKLHLGWKYALDLEMGYEGFHSTSLVKFRNRLLEGEAERVGFDALLSALRSSGLVRRGGKQRLDSTHVLGAVAKMSRLEMVRETIRLFLECVKHNGAVESLPGWDLFEALYMDSQIAWHRMSKDGLKEKYRQAGRDALTLIKWLRLQPAWLRDSDNAVLLERVFLEQYQMDAEEPQRRKVEASGVVKNPHDPDVQWATKDLAKKKQWEGYKVQIAETVAEDGKAREKGEPTEQFLAEVTTTEAIASDLDGRRRVERNQREHGQDVAGELYVDAAYVTHDTLAEARDEGRTLMGPARPSMNRSGRDLFTAAAFTVDIAKRKAVCPAGQESCQCSRLENQQTGQVDYRFEWAGQCDECALQKQCTRSRSGRRMVIVGEHHDLLQQRRQEMKTEAFKERMHQRNAIEGTVSEFVRGGGRRTRYRGLAKTTLANYFQGAAVNANRWIRLTQWQHQQNERKRAAQGGVCDLWGREFCIHRLLSGSATRRICRSRHNDGIAQPKPQLARGPAPPISRPANSKQRVFQRNQDKR